MQDTCNVVSRIRADQHRSNSHDDQQSYDDLEHREHVPEDIARVQFNVKKLATSQTGRARRLTKMRPEIVLKIFSVQPVPRGSCPKGGTSPVPELPQQTGTSSFE